jgi:DNA polymerase (family 10)
MERDRIVEAIEELAALSELLEENPFKVRAYANGARALAKTSLAPERWGEPGALESVPGLGKAIAEKVRELLASGSMRKLEELRAQVPQGVRELLAVPGLGPKRARALWRGLGVSSPGELEYACIENRLVALPGFGTKTQEKILSGLRFRARHAGKILLPAALTAQEELAALLARAAPEGSWAWTGESARLCPVVSGLEVVAMEEHAEALAQALSLSRSAPDSFEGLSAQGRSLLLRRAARSAFGAAVVWHASSPAFREALGKELAERGLAWNAQGLFRDGRPFETATEEAFWETAGRPAVPPECRESPEALQADLRELVREEDLRGAFHVHTDWSDGGGSLEEMVEGAERLGWEYLGICDHSVSAAYAGGLSVARLHQQRAAIAEIQERHPGLRIFAGVEADILADGALDYGEKELEDLGLDLVVASVHSRFNLDEEAQTRRLEAAVRNPATTFLGHPTGRLLLAREPYRFRWGDVAQAAASAGSVVELNANPHRLDVDWREIPALSTLGVKVGIHPDAHSVEGLRDVRYGIFMARKGLARKRDVVNTMDAGQVAQFLASHRGASP